MNKDVHQASQKVIEPLHSLVIRSVIFNLLITLLITSVRDILSMCHVWQWHHPRIVQNENGDENK